jgi:CHAT domain-containing protein/Flp pilus assembly protein TadD
MTHPINSVLLTHLALWLSVQNRWLPIIGWLILLFSPIPADAHSHIFSTSLPTQIPANPNSPVAEKQTQVPALEPDKPIERELAGGEAHVYQFTLAPGQYARVLVDQRAINIAVTLFGPAGEKIVESDVAEIGETEEVSLVADVAATFRLEVRSTQKTAPKGRYEIKITERRAATEQDRSRVAAERAVAEAVQLYGQQTADSLRKAIEKFQESLTFWRILKDLAGEATSLYRIAQVYISLGEKQKALDFCNQALPLTRAAGDRKGEAYTFALIGNVYYLFGDKQKALEFYSQALSLRRAVADRVGEGSSLNNIALTYWGLGERRKALDFYNQALPVFKSLGDRTKEGITLNNIGLAYSDLGEYQKALDFLNQALPLREAAGDRMGVAGTLNNMGRTCGRLGQWQQALDLLSRALEICKGLGYRQGLAGTLNNLAQTYASLGEDQKARDSLGQALEVYRAIGDHNGEATALNNLGAIYANLGEQQKAIVLYQQALDLARNVHTNEGQAIALDHMANSYSRLGERQKALAYYEQALTLQRAVGNPRFLAATLTNIGDLHRELGEPQKALGYLNEALQMSQAIGDRNGEAATLYNLARLERDRGNTAEASRRIEAALAAVESLRSNVTSPELRASFFASVRQYHEFYIDLLMRMHRERPSAGLDAAALQASERGRARSLLELLAEARAEIRQGVDSSLLEREQSLRQAVSDKAERQARLFSGKYTDEQAASAAKEIDDLTTEYQQVLTQIRQRSPRYAALTQPVPLTLKEIQSEALDGETLLLEYALGEEKSFLWAVTPTSISSYELPKRAEVESAARRAYQLLTARLQALANETPEQRRKRIEQADAEYVKAAYELSQMLVGPVAAELKSKRLVIVGEGFLQYTAFAALPSPVVGSRLSAAGEEKDKTRPLTTDHRPLTTDYRPLIADHEIISLPSASVLGILRRETAGRETLDKTLAIFADPVFDTRDPRVGGSGKDPAPSVERTVTVSDFKRSATESGLADLNRLRFSRQEADQIVRLATEGKRLEALDFAANRATATSPELAKYAIIHFATHGLINNQHPELSGVVLSLVDQQGHPQNGFLRLYDIYNLKLTAELVVLSACQTALGKEIKGEGLVGLTRGFMYAGARRVVASLWQVDDRATAELMRRFYEAMLGQGLRPAAALKAAQLSMWKDKRWQSPHYWAAFTLQGEWN